jgi:hypothetical protein
MQGQQFDGLVMAGMARGSRRRIVQTLLGGAIGVGGLGALTTRRAAAADYCVCTYDCGSHGFVGQCKRNSCPGSMRGGNCTLQGSQCGFSSKHECTFGP